MKSVTDTFTMSAIITGRLTGEGGKFQKQVESKSVKIDPVLLSFKEKFQVVTTTKGTMQFLMTLAHDPQATVDEQSEQVKLQCQQVHLKWSACCLEAASHNEGSKLVFQKLRQILPKTAS